MAQERERENPTDKFQHGDVEDEADWVTAALRSEQPFVLDRNNSGRGAVTGVATETGDGASLSGGEILEGGA
jgi:hypothetical protein